MTIVIPALTIRMAKADRTIGSHSGDSKSAIVKPGLASGTCKGVAVQKRPSGYPVAVDGKQGSVLVSRLKSHRLPEWLVALRVQNVMDSPHLEACTPEPPFLADECMVSDEPLALGSRLALAVWNIGMVRLDVALRVPMVRC
jgi:hypothetical protein